MSVDKIAFFAVDIPSSMVSNVSITVFDSIEPLRDATAIDKHLGSCPKGAFAYRCKIRLSEGKNFIHKKCRK